MAFKVINTSPLLQARAGFKEREREREEKKSINGPWQGLTSWQTNKV